MSKRQSDRKEDIQSAGQTDRVTERQNDSMADSRAAKEPALVLTLSSSHYVALLLGPCGRKGSLGGLRSPVIETVKTVKN